MSWFSSFLHLPAVALNQVPREASKRTFASFPRGKNQGLVLLQEGFSAPQLPDTLGLLLLLLLSSLGNSRAPGVFLPRPTEHSVSGEGGELFMWVS